MWSAAIEPHMTLNRGLVGLTWILRAIVSLVLVVLVVASVGDGGLLDALSRAWKRWYALIPALIIPPAAGYLLALFRLSSLLRTQNIVVPRLQLLKAILVGAFFNQLLPTSVGGDAYTAWDVNRSANHLTEIVATMVLSRVMGVIALCALILIGCMWNPSWLTEIPALKLVVPALLLVTIGIAGAFLLVKPAPVQPAGGGSVLGHRWRRVSMAFDRARRDREAMTVAALYSLCLQTEIVVQYWLFGWTLGMQLDFSRFLVAAPIVTLAAMLPLSLNGIGIREWVMIWICAPLGIGEADAAMMAMLFVLANLFYAAVGGLIFLRISLQRVAAVSPQLARVLE